jgi:hypothetical protein
MPTQMLCQHSSPIVALRFDPRRKNIVAAGSREAVNMDKHTSKSEVADVDERTRNEKTSEQQSAQPKKGSKRHIGQPGIESASGRDRSKGELPAGFGTDDGNIDTSAVAPPPGTVQGTRVGPQGDPTGAEEESDAR